MANATPLRTHSDFDAPDADITIQSSDHILFKLHRQNLNLSTGAFPGTEVDTQGETVHLTEPERVLEIVLQFIYPQRHPTLKNMDFRTLLEVSEAVEKYEVFSAMNICEVRLKEHLPKDAEDIFLHALKHDYPELMDEAALLLARSPLLSFVKTLPIHCVIPWIEYHTSWQEIFERATDFIEKLRLGSHCDTRLKDGVNIQRVCDPCRLFLLRYVKGLAEMSTLSTLQASIGSLDYGLGVSKIKFTECICKDDKSCQEYVHSVDQILRKGIKNVPPFTRFLGGKNVGGSS